MSQSATKAVIHKPPQKPHVTRPSVVLYGAIEPTWQTPFSASLADLPIDILDPRRDDWDNSWIEDVSFPKFKEQVEWEMDQAQVADVIVFHFPKKAVSPIALLELGLHAGTGKVVVCCENGFYKRGNVQMVCLRYGIEMVETLEELGEKVRATLATML